MDRRDFLKSAVLLGGGVFFGGAGHFLKNGVAGEAPDTFARSQTHGVFFSATGTTKRIVGELVGNLGGTVALHDISRRPFMSRLDVAPNDVVAVGVPVYSGRVPPLAMKSLANLKGMNTPAIAVVVYGNRDYDDALLELKDTLEKNGFAVVAGAAFIGQHAIFPKVAENRPDSRDDEAVKKFAAMCGDSLAAFVASPRKGDLVVKGNRPYKEPPPLALRPSINSSCTGCGSCVAVCPAKALELDRARRVVARHDSACISCAACIRICPTGAQGFRGEQYEQFGKVFAERTSVRREPEYFL